MTHVSFHAPMKLSCVNKNEKKNNNNKNKNKNNNDRETHNEFLCFFFLLLLLLLLYVENELRYQDFRRKNFSSNDKKKKKLVKQSKFCQYLQAQTERVNNNVCPCSAHFFFRLQKKKKEKAQCAFTKTETNDSAQVVSRTSNITRPRRKAKEEKPACYARRLGRTPLSPPCAGSAAPGTRGSTAGSAARRWPS